MKLDTNELKKLYLSSEVHHKKNIDKIKSVLSELKDCKKPAVLDNLLDALNYTNALYNVLKMQYLILYITQDLTEKKLTKDNKIPVDTALSMLIKQDWISDPTKEFLNKHFKYVVTNNVDYSQYLVNMETYFKNLNLFL